MFYILNKEKMISCAIALSTILVLFIMATVIPGNLENTISTANINSQKKIPIYGVKTDEKKIALTINCAWNADDIDEILKILKENNIQCTFFIVGKWAGENQEALKKISQDGHEIANHSYSHPHIKDLNYDKNIEEIEKCSNLIEKITGIRPNLYRGPYGEYNNIVMEAAKNTNNQVIQWSIDSLDWQGLTGEQMWERVENKLTNGSIILMHNGTENTALSLDMIIKNIKEKGYALVTVSELIYHGNYTIDANGMQIKN